MQKNKVNLEENKKNFFLFVFIIFFLLIIPCFFTINTKALDKPAKPSGPILGIIDTEYKYTISTTDSESTWKFDWGDGNYSDWIEAGQSCSNVSQSHSWDKPGNYNVSILYRSKYMEESKYWSSPLIVTITFPTDSDDDTKDTDNDKIPEDENTSSADLNGTKPPSSFEFPWLTAAITIIIVVLIVIFILFKKGIFYVYEEEYEVKEK
jgi:uncharacterized integral membrane protein